MLGNPLLLGDDGYNISRSVRLRSSATAYLNRTPAGAGNRQTWTWSGWVKRGAFSNGQAIFALPTIGGVLYDFFGFASDNLNYSSTDNGSTLSTQLVTTQVFRDPSAWYHIVLAVDTSQATASNRAKLYVNGAQVTAFSTATYPPQNRNTSVNSTNEHRMGRWIASYEDMYLTEVNFIDGQALTPSSFGQFDPATGVWGAKKYLGTYGTNGFYLNFADNSAATAAAIGKDSSGNGNNWTPNNISVTAGVTYDSMLDVPTMWGDGGNGRGNYATLNPLSNPNSPLFTVSNANLTYSCGASAGNAGRMAIVGTMQLHAGKTYWEVTPADTNGTFGINSYKDSGIDLI